MNKNSCICVLGSNGFVGKNLLSKLKADNYTKVFAFSRKEVDLLNQYDTLGTLSYGFDYVFICSAHVGGIKASIENPYKFLFNNLVIQNNVIDACIKTKVKKVLFLGSSCIYPKDYIQPLKEEYLLQAPLEETNEGYSLAKITGLKLCEYANKEFDTNFISLMPANLYGGNQDYDYTKAHVLGSLLRKTIEAKNNNEKNVVVWGTGNPRREFLHIDDLVDGMIWSMINLDRTDTHINIGTGEDISIKDLAFLIKQYSGYDGEITFDLNKPDGMIYKRLDVTKIHNLGWKHKINLEEGLLRTVKDYEKGRLS